VSAWLIVGLIGAGTYLTRLSFIGIIGERQIPGWCVPPLRYVAPAVLAALVAPSVMLRDAGLDLSPVTNPRFLAAVIAGVVTWRFKNVVWAIVAGMGALWVLQWLL
jgi:branched-subunit amino acid transport protein